MSREDIERGSKTRRNNVNNNNESKILDIKWITWIVPLFVVANVVMFLVVMCFNNCPKHERNCVVSFLGRFSFQPLKENPLFGPSSSTLEKLGGLRREKVVYKHQGSRLITSIWLHAGVVHLFTNMLSLGLIGIRLERHFGFARVGIIYLVSGFGGSVLSSLFLRNSISVGASGAVFGLLGAMLSELITNWSLYTNKGGALFTLAVIIAINLAIGLLPHVDIFCHIGGFLSGFLLGFILLPRPQYNWLVQESVPTSVGHESKYKPYQYALWLVSLVLLITGFAVALAMLFRGENGHARCPWCQYFRCIPSSRWHCDET